MAEIKVSEMTLLSSVPDDAKIYVVVPVDTTPYYTTKADLLAGISAGFFPDGSSIADWRISADAGEFWFYRNDGSGEQEKFRIETDGISFFDDAGNFKYWIKKPVSGTSSLVAPETTGDETIATQQWTNSAIDSAVVGLLDDRGNYDASGNLFPSSGGSGTSGAIKKGDLWTISVAGTLGSTAVTVGDVVRALVDSPGQIAANWSVTENNIGYVPENSANKGTVLGNLTSTTIFVHAKGVVDYVASLGYWVAVNASSGAAGIVKLFTSTGTATDGTMTQKAITDALDLKNNIANTPRLLKSIFTGNAVTGTETVVGTCQVGGISLGASFSLKCFLRAQKSNTTSQGNLKFYLNSSPDLSGSPVQIAVNASTSALIIPLERTFSYSGGNLYGWPSTNNAPTDVANSTVAETVTTVDMSTTRYLIATLQTTGTAGSTLNGRDFKVIVEPNVS